MKKTIKLLLGAIMLVAITSCSNQNKKMLSMIPQDAIVVVNLKSGSIIKNAGLEIDSKGVLALPTSLKSSMGKDDLEAFDDMAKKIAKSASTPQATSSFLPASKTWRCLSWPTFLSKTRRKQSRNSVRTRIFSCRLKKMTG